MGELKLLSKQTLNVINRREVNFVVIIDPRAYCSCIESFDDRQPDNLEIMEVKPLILLFKDLKTSKTKKHLFSMMPWEKKVMSHCSSLDQVFFFFNSIEWKKGEGGGEGLTIYISTFLLYCKYVPFVLKICNDLKRGQF